MEGKGWRRTVGGGREGGGVGGGGCVGAARHRDNSREGKTDGRDTCCISGGWMTLRK